MVAPALIPDRALVSRFRVDLEALTGEAPSPERRLGVAVSGGGDSLALLLLAAAAYPGAVAAATVDHGLRPEAAAEAAAVGAVCVRLGVPHDVLPIPAGFVFDRNLQDQARWARYTALAFWAARASDLSADDLSADDPRTTSRRVDWIASGHQQGDVAETFLMRARRGAGVGGLAAMPSRRLLAGYPAGTPLVRPLLGWSRATLAGVVSTAGIDAVCDPSNVDPRYDRSRFRLLIENSADLPVEQLARAAGNLRDAEEALAWAADREWRERGAAHDGVLSLDANALPHELKRRLVRRAVEQVHEASVMESAWRGAGLDRLVRLLEAGRPTTLAGVLARPGPRWRFTLAPARRTS